MTDQGKCKLGILIGVGVAVGLLPGLSLGSDIIFSLMLAAAVFMILTTAISIVPSSARPFAPATVMLALALGGVVQDLLLWLLVSWLARMFGLGFQLNGIGTLLAAAVIMRTCIWVPLLLLPGRAVREPASD
ncbi:hypothetical protein [Streptomyces sp. H27-D2]|uniref:hypothetical protein n=1 Tax=Streptomyces sp. H27-D2 TaxID=3046304 RepID=UPI002DB83633|nr:hypothetical protein [Streptomyces sp. H27-D2]MEC4014772.1 hypothetical protein [Streptomyces sp. H27-D2]